MFYLYGDGGGINKVVNDLTVGTKKHRKRFKTLKDALDSLLSNRTKFNMIEMKDLRIKYYGFDERINKDVYMITTIRYGFEKLKHPMFLRYLIEV